MTSSSTVINKSPRKVRLMINSLRGTKLSSALVILKTMNKEKTKKIYDLLKTIANNNGITEGEFGAYKIESIVAEEAQRLYRIMPRARGSAAKVRRRYARVKVSITPIS
jgi:large subunit ribosomal protein L22